MVFQHQHLALRIRENFLKNPDKIAIQSSHQLVTYRQLEKITNGIATSLQKNIVDSRSGKEIPLVEPVAILLDRSPELVEAILSILKCGLIFVPIDPRTPPARVNHLMAEFDIRWLITSKNFFEKNRGIFNAEDNRFDVLFLEKLLDEVEEFEPVYNRYAYIYFTSGSTGTPKGVLGRHRSLDHFIQWEVNEFDINGMFKTSQLTNPTFDPYLRDIFVPLTVGATCCIPDYETMVNPPELAKWIEDQNINLIHTVPTVFKSLTHAIGKEHMEIFSSLKYILLAGELLRGNDFKKWFELFGDRVQMVNLYGPTETTLAKFFYKIKVNDVAKPVLPVGNAIEGAQALILDEERQKCYPGNIGEVYIRTPFISSGYYIDAAQTKKVFIKNPYSENKQDIIYKTGDLGRLLPSGELEILGRIDHQIKIRGIRIELGEIENQILTHPGIKETVVTTRENENGEKYLCAYFVQNGGVSGDMNKTITDEEAPATDNCNNNAHMPEEKSSNKNKVSEGSKTDSIELKKYLSQKLPHYMIPTYFIPVDRIPLTPNGKVDRKSLPEPGESRSTVYVEPRNKIERDLVEIWTDVLKGKSLHVSPHQGKSLLIGIDDNFFDLGGHSLRVAEMVAKIHKRMDVKVPLSVVFDTPNIRKLAEYIRESLPDEFLSIVPSEKKDYYFLSSAQKRLYILWQSNPKDTSYNIPYWSIIGEPWDMDRMKECFKRLIRRHESLRTSFHLLPKGPVQLIHENIQFEVESDGIEIRDQAKEVWEEGISNTSLTPELLIKDFIRPFDLSKGFLLRVGIAMLPSSSDSNKACKEKNPDCRYVLMIDLHHIISDGTSINILIKDFFSLYNGTKLPDLKIQYKDFAEWHNSRLGSAELERQELYWRKVFNSEPPLSNLPIDYPRPLVRNFAGKAIEFKASLTESQQLRKLAKTNNVTMFILLLAITTVFLSKLTGQEDIVVGTVSAGRRHADLDPVIGMFVNTLALRNIPEKRLTFKDFLHQVKINTLQAFENQDFQFEDLVENVLPYRRDPARNPLFDVLFMCFSNPIMKESEKSSSDKKIEDYIQKENPQESTYKNIINRFEDGKSKFDMIIGALDMGENIFFSIVYQTVLFKEETIQRFSGYFKELVSLVLENQEIRLDKIKISHKLEKTISNVYEKMENEEEF